MPMADRVDWPTALARCVDDFARAAWIGRRFLNEAPSEMARLARALDARDMRALGASAEAMRAVLDVLGAPVAASIAEEMAHCRLAHARLLFLALRRDVNRLTEAVRAWPSAAGLKQAV